MKNLRLHLTKWKKRLTCEPLAIFLDYDGTLTDIAPTPAQARLPDGMRKILQSLVNLKDVKVAIISGRALSDLRKMVQVRGLAYVGSHGVEFKAGRSAAGPVPAMYRQALHKLRRELATELQDISGIWLERKPFSLAVHYRKASPDSIKRFRQVMQKSCREALYQGRIATVSGKKIIEIMPPRALNKGEAAKLLLRAWGQDRFLPVYVGDDRTDESAFDAFRQRGLTVRVNGPAAARSWAEYFVDSVDDVRALLEMIVSLRGPRSSDS